MKSTELIRGLAEIGVVRTGEFTLRSGRTSEFYFDLRRLVGSPALLKAVASAYAERMADLSCDLLAALPFAGLPIGVALALEVDRPLIYPRPAKKAYGTGNSVEGIYRAGQRALVVDDVVTDGGAKLEGVQALRDAGLVVEDVIVFLDREEGGADALAQVGCRLHSVVSMDAVRQALGGVAGK